MKRRSLLLSSLVATTALAVPVACQDPIPPAYLLTQPRILALRSTPPDVLPGGQVTLDALVYTPAGAPAPTYTWSWCASVDATLECATTAQALATLLDPDGSLGVSINYSLGTGPTATFTVPVTPAILQAACARRPGLDAGDDGGDDDGGEDAGDDAATPEGGISVIGGLACAGDSLTVDVLLTVAVGGTQLQAVRQLTLDFAVPDTANTNPNIDGVAPFTSAAALGDGGTLADPGDEADGAVVDAGVGAISGGVVSLAADVPSSATDLYANDRGGAFPSGFPFPGFDAGTSALDASVCIPVDASALDEDGGDAGVPVVTIDGGTCTPVASAQYESLDLAWYVESGQLDRETTTMPSVPYGTPQDWSAALLNGWTPPGGGGAYRMIVVARDNRGGVGWSTQTITSVAP